jgi:hypothetical protein
MQLFCAYLATYLSSVCSRGIQKSIDYDRLLKLFNRINIDPQHDKRSWGRDSKEAPKGGHSRLSLSRPYFGSPYLAVKGTAPF